MTVNDKPGPRAAAAVAEPAPAPPAPPSVEEWQPEVAMPKYGDRGPAWDGRRTRLRTAYAMMRNQQILLPGDTFEVNAVYDKVAKRWVGPEGGHVEDLFALGQIAGSKEAENRARLQAAIEHERGVHPTREDPEGRPDLASYTPEEIKHQWVRAIAGGQDGISRRERQESRSGDASVDSLAQQLASLLQGAAQHAGSAAPGTAVVDR